MIVLKRLFRVVSLCALLAAAVPGGAADYTAGTPGGAGKVTLDPESGDRNVEVTAPPPAPQNQLQMPVYVYPQLGRPGPYPAPPDAGPKPAKPQGIK
ncbi:MAG: hypothetical protein FWH34_03610 [Desulfovibrionaceae bacterium]|nr:hypothetical protein [Desulfovibrionaceae bacterium]